MTYPVNEELDMTPYWPDVGSTISANNSMSIEREKEILSTFPVRSQVPPFKYKLFGVANHYGNLTTDTILLMYIRVVIQRKQETGVTLMILE